MSQKPTAGVPGFRDTFRKYIPRWMQNRSAANGGNVYYRWLYSMIAPLDNAVDTIVQGLMAAWPGVGTSTADTLIGQSRGLVQGEAETAAAFEARCITWLDDFAQNGKYASEQMAREIQAFLAFSPGVTIVDRAGHWTILTDAHAGSPSVCTETTSAWNWDGTSNPERAGIWSDLWIIIAPPLVGGGGVNYALAPTFTARAVLPHEPNTQSIGMLAPSSSVDAILGIVARWKGAHTCVRAIIWSYDATWFYPGGNNPDGTWGNWSVGHGNTTKTAARYSGARYWLPTDL